MRTAALVLAIGISTPSLAQEFCDRPMPPEDFAPPPNDGEYDDYLRAAEAYINCLGREHQSTSEEMRAVLERWQRYFAKDARMRLGGQQTSPPSTADPSCFKPFRRNQ